MALDPIVWSLKDAPVADAIERLVLAIYAEHADEDGCNAFPSYKTVAERAMTDRRTVIRRVQDLVERGLLAAGDPRAATALPQRYRPKVYDVMIPYAWWGPTTIERINAYRAGRGRAPITPTTRPAVGQAPARARRTDAGRTRTRPQECLEDTPADDGQGCLPNPSRGDSEPLPGVGDRHPTHPYNPPHNPPPPPTPSTAPADAAVAPAPVVEEEALQNPTSAPAGGGTAAPTETADQSAPPRAADATSETTPGDRTAGLADALAVVAAASWPPGLVPGITERRTLARSVQPCLQRGHTATQVQQVMTSNLTGARNLVAVLTRRLADLAATAPEPAPAPPAPAPAQEAHPYVETRHGRCRACGRHEAARLHPPTAESTRRCPHGRHPVGCPQCSHRPGPASGHRTTAAAARTEPARRGLAALDQALARVGTSHAGHSAEVG